MNEALKIVLSLSLSGSLLIPVLLLCKALLGNRTSKGWQYYIWLVVIARLLLPFAPETSLVGSLFQGIDQGTVRAEPIPLPAQNDIADQQQPGKDTAEDDIASQSGEPLRTATSIPQAVSGYLLQNLWLIWLVVALILLIRKMTIYQGFVRYVKAGRAEVSDTDILDRLAVMGEQAGVKRPVELYTNSLISSPLLLGFFRPCIVLPTVDLPVTDFEYIILHELTHYRRRDMFYKWLVQVTICLHWFNPLAYLMGREVSRACELACDEAVIQGLDIKKQRAYGDTLLNAIATGGDYRDSLASMTLNESKELLKERLAAIMSYKKSTVAMICISGLLALSFLCGAAYAGAYRAENIEAPTSEAVGEKTSISNSADEYGMTVYVGGQDISQEIIRLWHSANNIYNVDDSETFRTGETFYLIEGAPEFIELLNYDQEVDAVFTGNGKAQLEQTKIGGNLNLIQKQGGRIYRMGAWKTGYSYAEALEGMKVIDYSGDTLVLEVKYKQPVGLGDPPVFGYADFTAKRVEDWWYVENYLYPEAYSAEETKSPAVQE